MVRGKPLGEVAANITGGANRFRLAGLAVFPWRVVHRLLTAAAVVAMGLFLARYT
jgi:hypothetical protein